MKEAQEEMTKIISKPIYTSSNNNNQHYQYYSGSTPGNSGVFTGSSFSTFSGYNNINPGGTINGYLVGRWYD
jgi:hypothetical protein